MKKLNTIFDKFNTSYIKLKANIDKRNYFLGIKEKLKTDKFFKFKKFIKPKQWIEKSQEIIEKKLRSND